MVSRPEGIRASAKRVAVHIASLSRLQKELARAELERKGATAGGGAALAVAAGLVALYAIGFGLAAVAAALALVMDWWLALLIVFVVLVLIVAVLALGSRALFRETGTLKPEQAIEEARLTKQALRGTRAG
jgi:membrane protein implicated in regulation of membrane protease activity